MLVQSNVIVGTEKLDRKKLFNSRRTLHWMGGVNYDMFTEITEAIRSMMLDNAQDPINLLVTSPGGASGIGMSFYDAMRLIYKPKLTTIGMGDVDSSGIIVFVTGQMRYVTPHTTLLLHLAGRTFENCKRFSTADMEAILREDKIKDRQYASIIAERSHRKLSVDDVLNLMRENTVLTAQEAVDLGIAHQVLK